MRWEQAQPNTAASHTLVTSRGAGGSHQNNNVLILEPQIVFLGSVHKLAPSVTDVVCQDTWLGTVLSHVRHVGRWDTRLDNVLGIREVGARVEHSGVGCVEQQVATTPPLLGLLPLPVKHGPHIFPGTPTLPRLPVTGKFGKK